MPNSALLSERGIPLPSEMTIMQRNLEAMSERICELENALQASHARVSQSQHPLLKEDLLAIKRAHLNSTRHTEKEEDQEVLDRETMAAFGKLSMSEEATELLGMPLVVRVMPFHTYRNTESRYQSIETRPHPDRETRLPER